ncbi:hypothetical protein RMATCC62417_16414 [Rhizopus microsporus]|nr:hypothetical protein RMATCC62417_16414 [Rhizopus microsporus]
MGKQRTTRKFAVMKRMISNNDTRLKEAKEKQKKKEEKKEEKSVRHMYISVTAVKFFLNSNEANDDDENDDDDIPDLKKIQMANLHSKKTKAKDRKLEAAKKKIKRKSKSKDKAEGFNFSALHLINDPQGFAEKLYSKLSTKEDRWEVRLMKMNLVSRVIARCHHGPGLCRTGFSLACAS